MRTEILNILRKKAPEPVSGEELAKQLGITRTAIWKHIQTLKKEGYGIEAFTKKGYVLTSVPDKLLPSEIMAHLHTRFVGRSICYEESVTSSNEVLKKLADKNAADGTVCVAEEQTGGKGRLARGWFSPKGKGLWFSLLLKPAPGSPQNDPAQRRGGGPGHPGSLPGGCPDQVAQRCAAEREEAGGDPYGNECGIRPHQLSGGGHRHQCVRAQRDGAGRTPGRRHFHCRCSGKTGGPGGSPGQGAGLSGILL